MILARKSTIFLNKEKFLHDFNTERNG